MICLDNTDTLEGGASVANVVDYTVHGLVGGVFTKIAQGQLSDTNPSVLYTAGAAISIVSITFVNTHSAAVTVDLYLDPANAGTPRRMIPKAMTLGIGYSMHFDGQRCSVLDSSGNISGTTTLAAGVVTPAMLENGTAVSDFLVAGADPYVFVRKTLAETQALIGAGVTYASAAEILAGTEAAKAIAPDQLKAANIRLPMGHLSGLTVAHAADTDHDITVAAGKARGDADTYDIVLAPALTKQIDATWAAGTNQGGMATGESIPASGTLHLWLIYGASGVDLMFNNHATTALNPTLPAGYNLGKRRIWSFRTDSSSNIINGDQWGTGLLRTWMYDTPILDVNNGAPGMAAVTAALSVPSGIIVKAFVNTYYAASTSTTPMYISSLNNADVAGSITAAPLVSSTQKGEGPKFVFTNTAAQIRYRVNVDESFKIATLGWEDSI